MPKPLVDIKTKHIRERGRQERASAKAKAARTQEVITTRRAAKVQEASEVAQARAAVKQQNRAIQQNRRARFVQAAETSATNKAVATATPSSNSNLIMTTIFTMAGLIIVYLLVTKAGPAAGFLNGVGSWLHKLSSNSPLFTSVAK